MDERKFKQKHLNDLFTFTRVNSKRKPAGKSVGITINSQALEGARNRDLDVSRICYQDLSSILDCIPPETQTVLSNKWVTLSVLDESVCQFGAGSRSAETLDHSQEIGRSGSCLYMHSGAD